MNENIELSLTKEEFSLLRNFLLENEFYAYIEEDKEDCPYKTLWEKIENKHEIEEKYVFSPENEEE